MDGDPGTADVEPNDAEFTQGSVSQYQLQGLLKIHMLQMRWNTFISTCHIFKQNEGQLKSIIKTLERELGELEERFTEVGNSDYNPFTKIAGSMKKQVEQLRENLMKNLIIELQDSKREM